MVSFREIVLRALAALRRTRLDEDTRAEMRAHLDMMIENLMARGLSRAQAEREAHLRAGTLASAIEYVQDQRGLGPLDGTIGDLKHAWTALRRQPSFLIVSSTALALAVALNTLIIALADGVLLRPLPYRDPARLVRVFESSPRNPKFPMSIGNYLGLRDHSRSFDRIALYTGEDAELMHGDDAERVTGVSITDDFLPTLGAHPALGRNFTRADLRRNARVVILSDALWTSRFNCDPGILGRTIRLDRDSWTVVGIMPPGFQHIGGSYRSPLQGDTVGIWRPLAIDLPENALRQWHFTNAVARLKPGVTLQQAGDDVSRIIQERARFSPDSNRDVRGELVPLGTEVVGGSRQTIELLLAAGALVLAIACVNVAGLSVARALARRRELAIRQALGGRSWRLVRALLSENVIVGFIGGAAGLAVAAVALPLLRHAMPPEFPRLHEVHLSTNAILFALAAALGTSLLAGLGPALQQARRDAAETLAEEGGRVAGSRGARRLRSVLLVSEIALACLLSVGTILLLRSSMQLAERDHGFDADHVLTFSISLPSQSGIKPERWEQECEEVIQRWMALPGVVDAGLGTNLPWTGYDENTSIDLIGRPSPPGESPQARFQAATPGLLRALRVRLVRGRLFDERDRANSRSVVIVNEAFAHRFYEGADPIGQHVGIWGDKPQIVGIVRDIRDHPADGAAEPAFWWPLAQNPFANLRGAIRAAGDPIALAAPVTAALHAIDPELPVADVRTMEGVAADALGERRFALALFQAFAGLALTLAAFGIYGMLSFAVRQRRKELSVRMALGASRTSVIRTVVSGSARLAASGIALGLLAVPLAARTLSVLLYGVTPTDVTSLIVAPLLVMTVGVIATVGPAWAAARTEPLAALREP